MSRIAVEQLLYLMDDAFEGAGIESTGESQSLLANLRTVTEDAWVWVPPGGHRTIAEIVGHVGACKYMYDDHAFGDARMDWSEAIPPPASATESAIAGSLAWLRSGQRQLRRHVSALDDAELLRPRRTNWGELKETRWLIAVMIEHDLYHAGEINHIRALRQDNDRWAWSPG